VAERLATFWNTEPSAICAYEPGTRRTSQCGLLAPDNAFYCRADGTVYWDRRVMTPSHERGWLAPVVVGAHEWGHVHQQRHGMLRPGRPQRANELHADCQAGAYVALEQAAGHFEAEHVAQALDTLCYFADAPGWSGAHGSCQTRALAFRTGYAGAKERAAQLCRAENPVPMVLELCADPLPEDYAPSSPSRERSGDPSIFL
jgi:predicted metalloprotease